jgi:hypothetical protein
MKKFHSKSELVAAKQNLAAKGWSYRKVAPHLNVHRVHLTLVLNGHRQSKRLLTAIHHLPDAPQETEN